MLRRVLRHPLGSWVDPAVAFRATLAGSPRAVWLDSGVDASAGVSLIAAGDRLVTASVETGTVMVDGAESSGTVLDFLRDALAGEQVEPSPGPSLGWMGWLGYELRAQTMGMPLEGFSGHPDAALLHIARAVVFDHAAHTVELVALGDGWEGELLEWRDQTVAAMLHATPGYRPVSPEPREAVWRDTDAEYLAMIEACLAAIGEGEAYQLCLTTEAFVDIRPDPLDAYLALRASSPSHHGSYFRLDGTALLGASPERFLSVSSDGVVESRPIKGTRPRGATPGADAALAAELLASDKERAENLMIVDLMRNDIARVSAVGSVSVPSLFVVESYPPVHQLVSTVRGRLAPGRTAVDAVESCFPAGSMTGAPKRRATEILDRLERHPRGPYAGAFGYFGLDGSVDLAMVIRSILLDEHGATIGAGGGITALSVPEEELAEVKLKAAALLAVLGAHP
jgi:para-aminobenzoate synthetase component 1